MMIGISLSNSKLSMYVAFGTENILTYKSTSLDWKAYLNAMGSI